jgi:hypothetical protein
VGISFGDTYYPGTQRPADAQPVTVRLGQERPGVDLSLQTVRLASINGVVIDSAGAPVRLAPRGGFFLDRSAERAIISPVACG